MRCRRVRGQLTHYIYGELNPAKALSLQRHLEACPGCHAELSSLERAFEALEAWEEASPGLELRQRLRSRLAREPLPTPAEIVLREAEAQGAILKLLGALSGGALACWLAMRRAQALA